MEAFTTCAGPMHCLSFLDLLYLQSFAPLFLASLQGGRNFRCKQRMHPEYAPDSNTFSLSSPSSIGSSTQCMGSTKILISPASNVDLCEWCMRGSCGLARRFPTVVCHHLNASVDNVELVSRAYRACRPKTSTNRRRTLYRTVVSG